MKEVDLTPEVFPDKRWLRGFEGGTVYAAERDGRYYLITDERGMADLLSDEDLAGMVLTHVREFDSEAERHDYAMQRGWLSERPIAFSRDSASDHCLVLSALHDLASVHGDEQAAMRGKQGR